MANVRTAARGYQFSCEKVYTQLARFTMNESVDQPRWLEPDFFEFSGKNWVFAGRRVDIRS